jgi:hypothetical protein
MLAHYRVIQWAMLVALAAFVVSLMIGSYAMTYGVLVSAFILLTGYLIAVGRFEHRMDPE